MKINRHTLSLLLVCLCVSSIASAQRIYFDRYFNKTKQQKAYWYREVVQVKSGVSMVEDHYLTGELYMTGYFATENIKDLEGVWSDVLRTGPFVYYYSSGAIQYKVNYKLGQKDGLSIYYYNNSKQVQTIGSYDMGNKVGLWREFYDDGTLRMRILYHKPYGLIRCGRSGAATKHNDSLVAVDMPLAGATDSSRYTIECYDVHGNPIACNALGDFSKVEKFMFTDDKKVGRIGKRPAPNYYVGRYLAQNLRYPQYAVDNGIDTWVYVCVHVRDDGRFLYFDCYSPCEDPVLQMEAIRALSQMPKWSKASKGKGIWPVVVPVHFKWKRP